jgi:hypothetical protein
MTAGLAPRSRHGLRSPRPALAEPKVRSALRSVLVPTEHGGWGLTFEAVLLGLLVAPSGSGAIIGAAAFIVFLTRTPLKVALVDRHRHRHLRRTRLARRAVLGYLVALAACFALALASAPLSCLLPLAALSPLLGIGLWFDMRSRSRRLAPELAGAIGITGFAATIALAGGTTYAVAAACSILLSSRAVTSIVTIRDRVGVLHGRIHRRRPVALADVSALALALTAVALEPNAAAGAAGVGVLVITQHLLALRPVPRATVLGLTQTALGVALVCVAASGLAS